MHQPVQVFEGEGEHTCPGCSGTGKMTTWPPHKEIDCLSCGGSGKLIVYPEYRHIFQFEKRRRERELANR